MKRPPTPVSDHAVMRYVERVMGINVERLRVDIGHAVDEAARAGASSVKINGLVFRIRDGVVTTVVPSGHQPRQRRYDREADE